MSWLEPINALGQWVLFNLDKVVSPAVTVIVGYVLYKIVSREVTKLKDEKRLESHLAYTLNRFIKWGVAIIVLSAVSLPSSASP